MNTARDHENIVRAYQTASLLRDDLRMLATSDNLLLADLALDMTGEVAELIVKLNRYAQIVKEA